MNQPADDQAAIAFLHQTVATPSLSGEEGDVARLIVEQMAAWGYEEAFVDEAGNAVGCLGPAGADRLIVLLGHIDTVPGRIPVRIYKTVNGPSESADSLLEHGASIDEFDGLFTHRTIKVVMERDKNDIYFII